MEDEHVIHEVVRLALKRIGGLVVKTSHSGPEALKVAEGVAPDPLPLDLMMPGKHG